MKDCAERRAHIAKFTVTAEIVVVVAMLTERRYPPPPSHPRPCNFWTVNSCRTTGIWSKTNKNRNKNKLAPCINNGTTDAVLSHSSFFPLSSLFSVFRHIVSHDTCTCSHRYLFTKLDVKAVYQSCRVRRLYYSKLPGEVQVSSSIQPPSLNPPTPPPPQTSFFAFSPPCFLLPLAEV